MKTLIRHGIVVAETSSSGTPQYLTANSDGIFIRTTNKPLIVTIAHSNKNYTEVIDSDVRGWSAASLNEIVGDKWLYMELNSSTAARSFGISTTAPYFGTVAPVNPVEGQTWYDTKVFRMKAYLSHTSSWVEVIRIFLGKLSATGIIEHIQLGSQIGSVGSFASGFIVNDGINKAITTGAGIFLTTEDLVFVAGGKSHALKVESNYNFGSAAESIPAFHAVTINDVGDITLATAADVNAKIVGVSTNSGVRGERIEYVLSGKLNNPMWNWNGVNQAIYVGVSGEVSTEQLVGSGSFSNKPPIGRTMDANTILLIPSIGIVQYTDGSSGEVDLTEILVRIAQLEQSVAEFLGSIATLSASVYQLSTDVAVLSDDVQEIKDKMIPEAPMDGLSYVRKTAGWVPETIPVTLPEAPSDGNKYVRYNGSWAIGNMIPEAPLDGNQYVRKDGAWMVLLIPEPPTPVPEYYDINLFAEAIETTGIFFEAIPMLGLSVGPDEFVDWTFGAVGSGVIEIRGGTDLTAPGSLLATVTFVSDAPTVANILTTTTLLKGATVRYTLTQGSISMLKSTTRFKQA